MSFDWENYLTLAKKISNSTKGKSENGNEALRRSGVSRAYYAIYHLAEDFAIANLSYAPPGTARHTALWGFYKRQFGNVDCQEVGAILSNLWNWRRQCDYDKEGLGNVEAMLGGSIINADRVKQLLRI